jgi:hypothetical protein
MDHTGFSLALFDAGFDLAERLRARAHPLVQARCADLEAEHRPQHLAGTGVGHHLTLDQIHAQGLNARSILGDGAHDLGKRGSGGQPTGGTELFFTVVLCHPQALRWQVNHLPAFDDVGGLALQAMMAMLALLNLVENHLIDLFQWLQVIALVARLASWLFSLALRRLFCWCLPKRSEDGYYGCLWSAFLPAP